MKNYDSLSDRELYRLTGAEDETAFSLLLRRYETFVFRIAYDVLRTEDDAADAAQDAFLKLWRGAAGWRGDCEVKTWIYRVAKTAALDRARSRTLRVTVPLEDAAETADISPTPEEEFERRERIITVRKAIEELPDAHREVIVMRELCDMSYREISEAAGIDMGTVKSRISRARAELYEILKEKLEITEQKRQHRRLKDGTAAGKE